MLLLIAKLTFSLALARGSQGIGGPPANHELLNQTLADRYPLLHIVKDIVVFFHEVFFIT